MPKRARGLVLGLLLMVAGPVTAVLITNPSQAADHAASPVARRAIGPVADTAHAVIAAPQLLLRVRLPIVAPPPKPPAAHPAPHRAPVVHRSAPSFTLPRLSVSQAQVVADITAAATRYGVNVSWMLRTANCESHFHWNSYNPSGPYYGVFQFLISTFIANGGTRASIWDPAAQANIAAKMFHEGRSREWSCA